MQAQFYPTSTHFSDIDSRSTHNSGTKNSLNYVYLKDIFWDKSVYKFFIPSHLNDFLCGESKYTGFRLRTAAQGKKLIEPILHFGTPHGAHIGAQPYTQ
jgi:hypothetical protein